MNNDKVAEYVYLYTHITTEEEYINECNHEESSLLYTHAILLPAIILRTTND